jgi:hypothetical protein
LEFGYFDGLRQGRIAVLPLVSQGNSDFRGQEYLGLYPVVERLKTAQGVDRPFVTPGHGTRSYIALNSFRAGTATFTPY